MYILETLLTFLLPNLPIGNRMLLAVEVYADEYAGEGEQGETFRVFFFLYLLQCRGCGAVYLHLYYIELRGGLHHDVHTPSGSAHLHIGVHTEEGEDDVEHLLVVDLVVGVVALRYGAEVCLQQAQRTVHIVLAQGEIHLGYGGVSRQYVDALHVVGQQTAHQSHFNLLVWDAERVQSSERLVVLYGDIDSRPL